ncbi:MAG: hypothetical protein GXP01_07640 [Alphaproteobacteria bacterium]|nr:hypothetical protein [Alphaproteobacteria bacterium]
MLKKIGIVMAVAAAMAVATAPAAIAHGGYGYGYDYKLVLKEGGYHGDYGQRPHYYKNIRISKCSVGGSSSAQGSIYTMTNSDSCSTYYKHKHYRGYGS